VIAAICAVVLGIVAFFLLCAVWFLCKDRQYLAAASAQQDIETEGLHRAVQAQKELISIQQDLIEKFKVEMGVLHFHGRQ
jgi:hypothetical protein